MDHTQSVIAHMLQVKVKDVQLQVGLTLELLYPCINLVIHSRFADWVVPMEQRYPVATRWPVPPP